MSKRHLIGSAILLALAGCGAGTQDASQAPQPMRLAGAVVRGDAIATTSFSGNLSQYTISGANLTVTDNISGTVTPVSSTARLQFADTAVAMDQVGIPGQSYRIYQAAFNRQPDIAGMSYWLAAMDSGLTLNQVSQSFIDSAEFANNYGSLNNTDFVTLMYQHVLHRAPDQGGFDYWLGFLNGTDAQHVTLSRAEVLADFSESNENKANVQAAIQNGVEYWPSGFTPPSNAPGDFAGAYTGNAKGSDSGSVVINIDASGNMAVLLHLTAANVDLSGTGTVAQGGKFSASLTGGSVSAMFAGSANLSQGLATGAWTITGGSGGGSFSANKPAAPPPPPAGPTFATVQAIIQQRCLPCHSAHPTMAGYSSAPLGIMFDTEAQIRGSVADIQQFAVNSKFMPYGNQTGMTDAERATIGAWITAGTP